MYNEPYHDDEKYRLRRKDDDKGNTFDSGTFVSWVLIPGIVGMLIMTLIAVILPSLGTSISRKVSFNLMAENAMKALDNEFSLLLAMKWGETNLGLYLLFGAILGIFIKYTYSDSKLR